MKKLCRGLVLLVPLFLLGTCGPPADNASPEGKLKGSVQFTSGGPAMGATVSLQGGVYSGMTDTTGTFLIEKVPAGSYTVTVQFNGVAAKTIDAVVISGKKTTDMGVLSISYDQSCTSNGACSSGSYCAKASRGCSGQGVCTARPSTCATLYDPVCGCDGKTYGNDCEAAAAGVSVSSAGSCPPPPAAGCVLNSECSFLEYCSKAKGDCDGTGTCKMRPTLCITLFDPVLGCDGTTYSNSCQAAGNGVNLR